MLDTKTWFYTDTVWKDLLTDFNGEAITYDAIGNPTKIGTKTLKWNGRQLAEYANGSDKITYAYNGDGQRISKTVNGTKTKYYYNGSILAGQKTGSNTLIFMYDNNGDAFGFNYNGTEYFYVKNLQNDITAITDASGKVIANYYYDAWGNITEITGNTDIANINPLRYRSYYYDTETNLYYLSSRYYAPDMCRFLNSDGYIQTGQGILDKNMFAYCLNSPVNRSDSGGGISEALSNTDDLRLLLEALLAGLASASNVALIVVLLVLLVVAADAAISAASSNKDNSSPGVYTVYSLVDKNDQVQYVGRTKNPAAREKAHKKNPYRKNLTFVPIKQNLTKNQARGLEQIEMMRYHTLNTNNKMNNQINGISPFNKNADIYLEAGLSVAKYLDNQITNEILCWAER